MFFSNCPAGLFVQGFVGDWFLCGFRCLANFPVRIRFQILAVCFQIPCFFCFVFSWGGETYLKGFPDFWCNSHYVAQCVANDPVPFLCRSLGFVLEPFPRILLFSSSQIWCSFLHTIEHFGVHFGTNDSNIQFLKNIEVVFKHFTHSVFIFPILGSILESRGLHVGPFGFYLGSILGAIFSQCWIISWISFSVPFWKIFGFILEMFWGLIFNNMIICWTPFWVPFWRGFGLTWKPF